jgi:TonB family protein
MSTTSLRISLRWRDTVLDTLEVRAPRTVTAGSGPGVDVTVDTPLLGERFAIATVEADRVRVELPPGARARGPGDRVAPEASILLGPGQSITVDLGDLSLDLSRPPPLDLRLGRPPIDADFARVALISLVLHAFLVVLVLISPRPSELIDVLARARSPFDHTRTVRVPDPPKAPKIGKRHFEGKKGPPLADSRRTGFRGKDPRHDRALAKDTGLLALLRGRGGASAVVLSRGDLSGVANAIAALGPSGGTADAGGTGGLGTRGDGPGCPGCTALEIGEIGDPRGRPDGELILGTKKRPRVTPCGMGSCRTHIEGISRAEVSRVILRNLPRFKYCYERELNAHPNLSGKVTVRFTIAPTGQVAEAGIGESSLDNEAVQQCVVKTMASLVFPAPRGGGIAVVSYPFVFNTL